MMTAPESAIASLISDGAGAPKPVLRGSHSRCNRCQLSIRVIESPTPQVCPFCHSVMRKEHFVPAPPTPEPPGVMAAEAVGSYRRLPRFAACAIAIGSILLLAVVLSVNVYNLENFWYQPRVNAYSLWVGVFILPRFITAAFYRAPLEAGYEPTVTVVVACRNEEGSIEKTIGRSYREGYPHDKLDVVAGNDGSTNNTLAEMIRAQERHPNLVIVDFEKNRCKWHGCGNTARPARRAGSGGFRVCVIHSLERWLFPRFMVEYAACGDDRSLTNFPLKDHKILYAGRFLWRKTPLAAIAWYAKAVLSPARAPRHVPRANLRSSHRRNRPHILYRRCAGGGAVLGALLP